MERGPQSRVANAGEQSRNRAPALDRARVPELVLSVLRTLHTAGKQAFLAGGAVRDLARLALGQLDAKALGDRWPADFDVATDALPEEVMKLFRRTVATGIQHGTVTVIARAGSEEHKVEVTTFRGEGPYLDGRRPSAVSFLGDIEGDLSRRDFTVNAMAWNPLAAEGESELRDPFGGLGDLQRRVLRAVGDPRARFAEDGLRPMRAVRFASTLRLALEPKTRRAIGETLGTFALVARERVRDELEKLLVRGRPASRGLRLLLRSGLLETISPQIAELARRDRIIWRKTLRAIDLAPEQLAARVAILLSPLAKKADQRSDRPSEPTSKIDAQPAIAICDELRFPSRTRDRIALLVREQTLVCPASASDGDCRRAIARIGPLALDEFFAFRRALAAADGEPARDDAMIARWSKLLAEAPALSIQALAIDGKELMRSLNIPPGPDVGRLLRALLEKVFDDPSLNSADILLQLASDALRAQSTGNPQP